MEKRGFVAFVPLLSLVQHLTDTKRSPIGRVQLVGESRSPYFAIDWDVILDESTLSAANCTPLRVCLVIEENSREIVGLCQEIIRISDTLLQENQRTWASSLANCLAIENRDFLRWATKLSADQTPTRIN